MNHLYLTATESKSGKSAIVLGMMELLLRNVRNVGFFRPIIADREKNVKDHDIDLVLTHFGLTQPYEDTFAYTMTEARQMMGSGRQEDLFDGIIKKYKKLTAAYEFVLCEGTDFEGKEAAFEFELNVEIAAALGTPVMLIVNGAGKSAREIIDFSQTTLDQLDNSTLDVLACFVNRTALTEMEEMEVASSLKNTETAETMLTFVLPEESSLGKPSMDDVRRWLGGEVLYGEERLDSLVDGFLIGAMHVQNFLDYIEQGQVIVTPGDRVDIIISCLASHYSRSYGNLAGLILTGGFALPHSVKRLFEGWNMPLPVISVPTNTSVSVEALSHLYGKIEPADTRKINTALGHFSSCVDSRAIVSMLINRQSSKISPKMFEYNLLERAASKKMRIVLPEGAEDRILRATDLLMRRNVADIILLGDPSAISRNIDALGLEIDAIVIDPEHSPKFDEYVEAYFEARKAKGISMDQARDIMKDPSYFGTMMVHKGDADGMVSGAINTTAHTIRPSLEFVKTKPGTSIVSSVFLMCMKDRVLVFGDCAVNPNPTAEQLASIAISSAETAKVFGIEPRVAMLSYSTGASGKGADVELVIDATKFAKERAPELALEGPLQYDAAIDAGVARTKMPDSQVAGKATVFIFPDLNTGNNTYKAVQRAADAVAIGPVLQGLNKPVNDLSRGCTVPDIVNTVAITAIQAQATSK